MKIALVTLQGNPFGQTPEAGPDRQDQRLASLVSALAEQDHDVTVYARRDSEGQPEKSKPAPGVTVEHVRAGPAKELSPDHLAPHAAEFGQYLARFANNYVTMYAGLASVIIALVFLYFIAAIFVYGGELNAAIIKSRLPHGVSLQAAQSLAPLDSQA